MELGGGGTRREGAIPSPPLDERSELQLRSTPFKVALTLRHPSRGASRPVSSQLVWSQIPLIFHHSLPPLPLFLKHLSQMAMMMTNARRHLALLLLLLAMAPLLTMARVLLQDAAATTTLAGGAKAEVRNLT